MFLDSMITTRSLIDGWKKGLSVILEKIKGNINMDKFRGILLWKRTKFFKQVIARSKTDEISRTKT